MIQICAVVIKFLPKGPWRRTHCRQRQIKRLRRYSVKLDAITIPSFISKRYGEKKPVIMCISALIILIFFVPYVASQITAHIAGLCAHGGDQGTHAASSQIKALGALLGAAANHHRHLSELPAGGKASAPVQRETGVEKFSHGAG